MTVRRQKVDSKNIMSRIYEDSMQMPPYSLNIGENQGSVAAAPITECTLRYQDRRERQPPEFRDFWDRYHNSR